ncbi:MAG: hypothetical protein ACFFC7_19205 [Candidatus Hermodarchaeota archaeon]
MADTREIGKILAILGGILLIIGGIIAAVNYVALLFENIPISTWLQGLPTIVIPIVIIIIGLIALYNYKAIKHDTTLLWGIIDLILAILVIILYFGGILSFIGLGAIVLLVAGVLLIVDAL